MEQQRRVHTVYELRTRAGGGRAEKQIREKGNTSEEINASSTSVPQEGKIRDPESRRRMKGREGSRYDAPKKKAGSRRKPKGG